MEILVPRASQYLASSNCLWKRDLYVIPFDNIGTTVFIAELVSQLRPGTWTWTSWRHSNHAQRANTSTRKKPLRTRPKKSPSYCNLGFRPILQPTMPVNNVSLNWKLNLPESNRTTPRHRQLQRRLQNRPPHQLVELYKDNHRPLHHLIRHASWSLLGQSINGLWTTNPLR